MGQFVEVVGTQIPKFHTLEDAQIVAHYVDDIFRVKFTYRDEEAMVRRIDLRPLQLAGFFPKLHYTIGTVVDVWSDGYWCTGHVTQILMDTTVQYTLPESKLYGGRRQNNVSYVVDLPSKEDRLTFSDVDTRLHLYV